MDLLSSDQIASGGIKLKAELTYLRAHTESASSTIAALRHDAVVLNTANSALQSDLAKSNATIANNANTIQTLQASLQAKDQALNNHTTTIAQLQTTMATLEANRKAQATSITDLMAANNQFSLENAQLANRLRLSEQHQVQIALSVDPHPCLSV